MYYTVETPEGEIPQDETILVKSVLYIFPVSLVKTNLCQENTIVMLPDVFSLWVFIVVHIAITLKQSAVG